MDSIVSIVLAWALISFYLYWPVFFKVVKGGNGRQIHLLRIFGGFVFGFIPIVLLWFLKKSPADGLGLKMPTGDLIWHLGSIGIALLSVPVSFLQARNASNLREYPQIRSSIWTPRLILLNAGSWMFYLIGYEMLFRGFLLFPLLDSFEPEWVVLINISFYSLSHAAKNIREGLGTIPIGLILFFIAWKTDSIFYTILIHWAMALGNSYFSVYHHPEMSFQKKRRL